MNKTEMKFRNKIQSGFTLIEMLVVISIIAIIATIGLIGLNRARTQGRDAKRIADITHIQNELEIYRATHNTYPSSGWVGSSEYGWQNSLGRVLGTTLPTDPSQDSGTASSQIFNGPAYGYAYYSGDFGGCKAGMYYILVFKQERLTIQSPGGHWCDGVTGEINYKYISGTENNITYVMGAP